ncbi:MAG TPA: ATP-binding cassette domain-containing protein [Dehalococcoidia bacterium]
MTAPVKPDLRTLESIPLFARCSSEEIGAIADGFESLGVSRDTVIFREGDGAADMYIVAAGQVRIVSDVETEKVVLAHFGPGDFFGEMALLSGEPRSAGAIATTDATLLRLSRDSFHDLIEHHPGINEEISRVLAERVARGNNYRFQNEAVQLLSLTSERDEMTIGRWPENDLQISDPQIDGVHARLTREGDHWVITDENSNTGTYVNRQRVHRAELHDGDEVLIGTNRVYLDGLNVKSFATAHGVRMDAVELVRTAGGRRILDGISLSIIPGEFVALVGGSGAGKTSLLHALNGFSPADGGRVLFDGVDLYPNLGMFRSAIGYLPQDDIIHPQLTVERTLVYAARLRLPGDLSKTELAQRIEDVLRTVNLTEHRAKAVSMLSGGQRKRLSLAVELLATPRAFFLDEPTSGLDPALETRMMELFRSLTAGGVSLIISTHSTQSLRMCDKIAWLSRGRLVFFGSPAECLRHFHVTSFGEIYDLLNEDGATEHWAEAFVDTRVYQANIVERQPAAAAAPRAQAASPSRGSISGGLRQLYWLTVRYAEIMLRDPKYVGLLLIQAPAIALSLILLFRTNIFAVKVENGGDALLATAALKALMLSAIWIGAFNAARAISSETAIYARERLVNLGILPYVGSKVIVLAFLCLVQAALLVGIVVLRVKFPGLSWHVYPSLVLLTFVVALGGLAMGLLISSLAENSDQAMAIVPILLIPQLIFDGSFVPVAKMLGPARVLADIILSRWALEMAGSITHMTERFAAQLPPSFAQPYEDAFTITAAVHWGVLAMFILAPLAATLLAQRRKDSMRLR